MSNIDVHENHNQLCDFLDLKRQAKRSYVITFFGFIFVRSSVTQNFSNFVGVLYDQTTIPVETGEVDLFLGKFPDPDFRVPMPFILVLSSPISSIFTLASKSGSHGPIKFFA